MMVLPSQQKNGDHLSSSFKIDLKFPNKKKTQCHLSYHAVTRGLLLNEIMRKTDPQHRRIGKFIQDEITEKLGVDFFLSNLPETKLDQVKPLTSEMQSPYFFFTISIPVLLDGLLDPIIPTPPKIMKSNLLSFCETLV